MIAKSPCWFIQRVSIDLEPESPKIEQILEN